ncbi:MAG: AAA family ATPase [Opitutaceae bacterium]|jgi:ATP-dependent Clp protease ATP-binding subunit ClpB|nr:AAA family ATPase [Opitutaceae bacterium]
MKESDEGDRIGRLRSLEAHLFKNIRGQDRVLARVVPALMRGELGLSDPSRPRASFLFVGPTGTGKSELASVFSEYLFGADSLMAFDMSEYQNKESIEKMIGADRSDVGLLGRALSARACGTLLFDEMEKAHPEVLDLFLQMLWLGRITVATGRTFALKDYYVVFTSNIGAVDAMRMERSSAATVEESVLRRVRQKLRPELVGRIDEIAVFSRLGPDGQREICSLLIEREIARLGQTGGYRLDVSEGVMEFLLREGYDPHYGARPMQRAVSRHIQDAVVRALFEHGIACGRIGVDGRRLCIAGERTVEK